MREKTQYNKLIGRIGNDYYFLNYTFKYSDNFKGATGSILTPLTEKEIAIDNSYWRTYGQQLKKLLGNEAVFITDCVGGGRCFTKNMVFDEVFNQKLLDVINAIEE